MDSSDTEHPTSETPSPEGTEVLDRFGNVVAPPKARKPSTVELIILAVKTSISSAKEVKKSVKDPDKSTRRMAYLFFISVLSAFCLLGFGIYRHYEERLKDFATHINEDPYLKSKRVAEEKAAAAKRKAAGHGAAPAPVAHEEKSRKLDFEDEPSKNGLPTFNLGKFSIELKPPKNRKIIRGLLQIVEMELVVECDTKKTCAYIEKNIVPVRGEITDVFTPLDRDEILSREGKRRFLREVIDKVNNFLPDGKIENIYVNKMVIS